MEHKKASEIISNHRAEKRGKGRGALNPAALLISV